MRYALMIEPQQGMSYEDIRAVALAAERAGIETLFRSDHYSSFPSAGLATTDAWATTAGLARDTSTLKIGVLVSPVTFRLPGPLAKTAATVHEMSGGRVELGIGAGWHEGESRQFGIPFPPVKQRLDMLEEYAAVVRGLWTQPPGWSFRGTHYQVEDALFEPRPDADGRPPIHLIMGGDGSRAAAASPPSTPTSTTSCSQRQTAPGPHSKAFAGPATSAAETQTNSSTRLSAAC